MAWNNRFAGSSVIARWLPPAFKDGLDPDSTEGAIDLVYDLPNFHVEYVRVEPPGIPTAFWRSVGPSHNVFVTESFMDETGGRRQAGCRSLIGVRFSTSRPAPRLFLSLPLKRRAGDSRCLTGLAVASPSSSPSEPIWRMLPKLK